MRKLAADYRAEDQVVRDINRLLQRPGPTFWQLFAGALVRTWIFFAVGAALSLLVMKGCA